MMPVGIGTEVCGAQADNAAGLPGFHRADPSTPLDKSALMAYSFE